MHQNWLINTIGGDVCSDQRVIACCTPPTFASFSLHANDQSESSEAINSTGRVRHYLEPFLFPYSKCNSFQPIDSFPQVPRLSYNVCTAVQREHFEQTLEEADYSIEDICGRSAYFVVTVRCFHLLTRTPKPSPSVHSTCWPVHFRFTPNSLLINARCSPVYQSNGVCRYQYLYMFIYIYIYEPMVSHLRNLNPYL